jgi:hypothetical protein
MTVSRASFLAGFVVASLGLTGCAGTWDTLTSRRFREHPLVTMQQMVSPEDPVVVLRANPPRDGDTRAAAMRRLKEPLRNKGTPEDQDAILDILARAVISDPSPVLRMEAVGALGRFEDPRAAGILIAGYQAAHGRREGEASPPRTQSTNPEVIQTGLSAGRTPTRALERFPITGPTGFPPEWVNSIRCRVLDSLGRTNRPEAAQFLAVVAGGAGRDIATEGSDDPAIRVAAVRGLGKCRQPESVVALAQVLNAEVSKPQQDTAIIGRTHEGLVRLTGKRLPPDPEKWREVVLAGVEIAPEPSWWDNAVEQAVQWAR